MNTSKNIFIWLGILVVVIVLLSWWLLRGGQEATNPAAVGDLPGEQGAIGDPSGELVVNDQFPGTVAYVSRVSLPQGGWVVIHRELAGGAPGAVIGAEYFSNQATVGSVDLVSPTVNGMSYIAMLHRDNGDQVFTESVDTPILGAGGEPIMVRFTASTALPEQKG